MANPLAQLIPHVKQMAQTCVPRARRYITGIAHDFWKDGTDSPIDHFKDKPPIKPAAARTMASRIATIQEAAVAPVAAPSVVAAPQIQIWHAEPGEISEKMWGQGYVTPCDVVMTEALIAPLSLDAHKAVLDLSAGLGSRSRIISEKFGLSITGLEPDPDVAARGMELSIMAGKSKNDPIATYEPSSLSLAKKYDCILARETFYRAQDKNTFFTAIAGCAKPSAQLSFTDYIVNPEDREKPAVSAWQKFEDGALPLSLVEMAEAWAKVGFTISTHEDQTALYRKEIPLGLKRLAVYLASGIKPDKETKASILKRIQTWTHRMAALEQGMKLYRFYGTKQ